MIRYEKLHEKKVEDVEDKIIEFFMKTPSPSDEDIHKLSDDLSIDTHEFEAIIYGILGSILSEGKSKDFKGKYDPKQIEMGLKVEMEHTTNKAIALKIVHDHLAEFSNYYTELLKMEKNLENK